MPDYALLSRIESELEVQAYLQDLRYALDNGATIDFRIDRVVDQKRDEKYTNRYTVATLFPNEDPVVALRRELKTLTVAEYMQSKG